jgi:hypothetical protein
VDLSNKHNCGVLYCFAIQYDISIFMNNENAEDTKARIALPAQCLEEIQLSY